MTLRIIGAAAVREVLTMERCIALMREAMALVGRGETVQPLRHALWLPDKRGLLGLMPGYVAKPERLGVKAISVFPSNFAKGLPSHQGVVMLFSAETGAPEAIIDGRWITAIRTAAATAVATDVLARREAKTLAFLGYGEQAETHLEALTQVRKFERLLLWGARCEKGGGVRGAAQKRGAADRGRRLGRGSGACRRRVHADRRDRSGVLRALAQARHACERGRLGHAARGRARRRGGQALAHVRRQHGKRLGAVRRVLARETAGAVDDKHIVGAVGDVMVGKVEGRRSAEEITLFKSLGMAVEDIVSAEYILAEAKRRNIGQAIAW